MWRFSKDSGWQEAESFLLAADKDDCRDELHECGFLSEPTIQLGKSEELAVEIYHRFKDGAFIVYKNPKTGKALEIPKAIDVKDEFLAMVEVDLIAFLSQLVPICRELRENAARREQVNLGDSKSE